jgi:anti-sigma regulatory factor (Ser/Thr protein kinase)
LLLLETELPNGPAAAAAARRSVASLRGPLPETLLPDLALLVSELVTNSHRHAGIREGDPITLRVLLDERTLRIEVADRGTERHPAMREPASEGGWGLHIVERLTDRWGSESSISGTVVWFELDSV